MKELMFEDQKLQIIERDGEHWLRLPQIGAALGYANQYKVQKIYESHAVEFTSSMTALVKLPDLLPQDGATGQMREVRVFSLRGAHLIGMFARTAKAQEFRRWVLDVLDENAKNKTSVQSLMSQWYEAKAELDNQQRFASLCGKGLSDHKTRKPPLYQRVINIAHQIQPQLQLAA